MSSKPLIFPTANPGLKLYPINLIPHLTSHTLGEEKMNNPIIYNHPELKNRRRDLRRKSTATGYVMDFFCPEQRLAIEDEYRYRFIEALDITILKIKNQEIINNVNAVCDNIYHYLNPSHKVGEGIGLPAGRQG